MQRTDEWQVGELVELEEGRVVQTAFSWPKMMTAGSGDSGGKWSSLRDVYRIPSTRLSNELDDEVTEREG